MTFLKKLTYLTIVLTLTVVSYASAAKLGVYSGSFDPPTKAHFAIMKSAFKQHGVEKLLVMVNEDGGKDFNASIDERIGMIREMTKEYAGQVEILPVTNANKNVLPHAKVKEGNFDKLYRIIGQDSFETLPPEVMNDPGNDWMVVPRDRNQRLPTGANVHIVEIDGIDDVSSTAVRKALAENKSTENLLDPAVTKYIKERQLYALPSGEMVAIQEKLHREAFQKFIKDADAANPQLHLGDLPEPPFKPQQSRAGWNDQFKRWVQQHRGTCFLDVLQTLVAPTY
jgi:nicotinic acid mononucleotide adenylyltransferase